MLNLKTLWFAGEAIFLAETAFLDRLTHVFGKLILLLVVFAVLLKTVSRVIKLEGPEKAAMVLWRTLVVGMAGYACLLVFPAVIQLTDDMIGAIKKELPSVRENRALAREQVRAVDEANPQQASGPIKRGLKKLSFWWGRLYHFFAAIEAFLGTMGARLFMETLRTVMLLCLIPLGPLSILLTLFGLAFPFVAFLENSFKSWFSFYLPIALSTLITQVIYFAQNALCATMVVHRSGAWGQLLGMLLQWLACVGIFSSVKMATVLVNGLVSPPDLSPSSLGIGSKLARLSK